MARNDSTALKNKKLTMNTLDNSNEISSVEKSDVNSNSMVSRIIRNQPFVNHPSNLSQRGILIDYEKFKSNRYGSNDQGSFVVQIIDSRKGFNIGNFHIVSIGVRLFEAGFKVTALRKSGPIRVSLSFHFFQEANNFIDNGIAAIDANWRAYIPDDIYFKIGIITDVPPEIPEDIIIRGFVYADNEIVEKVERISKYVDSDQGRIKDNSENIKIFCKKILSTCLDLYGVFFSKRLHMSLRS